MSGTQVSSFAPANVLFDAASGAPLINNQNALLQGQREQQVINATDVEMTARFAQTLTGMSEEEAARAYGPGIAYLQSQGFAKRAPPVFPGLEVTKRLADMGVSATEQYKTRQDAAGLATVAGAYGFNPPGSGGTATPGGGGATGQARLLPGETEDQFLARIEARESGGRNVMNYRNKEDPSKFTAGGYYQIVDSTWKAGAQAAGIDISQYPTAISAPREVQTAVARSILRNFGPQHWNQSEPGATQQANAAPRAPGSGSTPPPGVQMGGAPPGPPGGAPGPYGGGGFGTALNTPDAPQMRETFVRDPDGTVRKVLVPTGGAPVATTPPAPGGGTASNVPGLVNAMFAGINRAQTTPGGGAMFAGPGAPTEQRQVSSVEPPPQPGWGTAVGSYGDGAASVPAAQQPAAPAAPVAPSPATRPPPAAAMPPELQTDKHNLTERDRAELGGLLRAGRISPLAFQNEVQQRQNANDVRKNHWETQQTAQQNAAATAAQRDLENRRNAAKDKAAEVEAAKLEQSKGEDADHLRVLQAFGPRIRRGEKLTDAEENQYDLHRRAYAEGPEREIPDGKGGTIRARMGREVSDRFPPLPGQKEYAGIKPIPGTEKQPDFAPANAMTAMLDIGEGNRKIVKALDQLEAYPGGVGPLRGSLPNVMSNWTDPEGVKVRAAIGDVQGHQYHTLAGAAQSAAESGRLRTFVAGQTDDAEASKIKLRSMLDSNRQTLLDHYRSFGPDAGGRRLRNIEEEILATIPEDAVARLKREPDTAKRFDRKYGRGAANLVLQNG